MTDSIAFRGFKHSELARRRSATLSILSVTPSFGFAVGGTSITELAGIGFENGAIVTFGGIAATGVVVVSPERITCTTPVGSGVSDILVTILNGNNTGNSGKNLFTFVQAPQVTSITPQFGLAAGGTTISDLHGMYFVNGATVTIGGVAATGVAFVSDEILTCTSPAGSGVSDVVVTNPDTQTSGATGNGLFTIANPPAVSGVTPAVGAADATTSITDLAGTDFVNGATVTFGGVAATGVAFVSATQLTCTTPVGIGTISVVVTNPDTQTSGATGANAYAYSPVVSSLSVTLGSSLGGTATTITGVGFVTGATVTFDGVAASSVTFVSSTSITCVSPTGTFGSTNIVVTNPDATTSGASGNGLFYYFTQINLTTLPPGGISASAFVAATGLDSFTRAAGNPVSMKDTVQISSTKLSGSIEPNYARIFSNAVTAPFGMGLLIEQGIQNQLNGSDSPVSINSGWTASGAGTQTTNYAEGPSGSISNASRLNIPSVSVSNYYALGSDTTDRYVFSMWHRSRDATTIGNMQTNIVNAVGTIYGAFTRAASDNWAIMSASTGGKSWKTIIPLSCKDLTPSGGYAAAPKDVLVDYMQLERGDFPTSCVSRGKGIPGQRERDVVSWTLPMLDSRVRYYARFKPIFTSTSSVYYNNASTPTAQSSWTIFESATPANYLRINDSDKKLVCSFNGGAPVTSTNAISFLKYDDVEILVEAGNNVATTLSYRVNSGSWTDLAMANITQDPTLSSPFRLMTGESGGASFPCILEELRAYPIEVTTIDV